MRQGQGRLGGRDLDGAGDELAGLAAAHSHQLWRVGGADEVTAQGAQALEGRERRHQR